MMPTRGDHLVSSTTGAHANKAFLRVPPRDPPRLVCFGCPQAPVRNLRVHGGYVTNGGMELVRAVALKQLPSQRFSPSPFPCNAVGPGKTLTLNRIGKTGRACTFET